MFLVLFFFFGGEGDIEKGKFLCIYEFRGVKRSIGVG